MGIVVDEITQHLLLYLSHAQKKTCGNVCTNNPVYENCMPQNKTQSRYYGQIILTDYVTCTNEKGIFTPITNNCSHKEHNYHFYTYDYGTCDLR